MAKQHRSDDGISRGAMTDTRKESQLRKESEWSNRQWKNTRITEKESQRIRGNQRERNTLRRNIRKIELHRDGRGRNSKEQRKYQHTTEDKERKN